MFNIDEPAGGIFNVQALHEAQEDLSTYANAIFRYRNIGTYLMELETENADERPDITGAVIGLFRRLLELMDASALLIESGSIVPVKPLIRIMFELGCQFEYLLMEPERRQEKALCMFIAELNEKLVNDKKLLTIPGIERATSIVALNRQIDSFQAKIDLNKFDPIRAQYNAITIILDNARVPTGERRGTSWFTIADSDIKKITNLISKVNREKFEFLIYAELSNVVHSSSLMADSLFLIDGVPAIKPLRATEEADACTDAILKVATYMYDLMNDFQPREKRVYFYDARSQFIREFKENWYAVYTAYL
jgi:hypothetical protein